uniref:Uncharacterized protein n=1 Tax=Picea glauca TaxID=3330 RepID=A0A101M160_PICGL|nr:hypothetical protein ABT39_MTgene4344 [Picea glauca]
MHAPGKSFNGSYCTNEEVHACSVRGGRVRELVREGL